MMKRIIIFLDFSPQSDNLLKSVSDMRSGSRMKILLAHSVSVLAPALADNESRAAIARAAVNSAMKQLKTLRETALPQKADVGYWVSEMPVDAMMRELAEEDFENIFFTGLKGTGLLKKIFIGTTALKIIENAENIVVALPQNVSNFPKKTIYVAVSDKHDLNILELNNFFDFIKPGIGKIIFFHLANRVNQPGKTEKKLKDLANLFSGNYKTAYAIYAGANAFAEIKKVINDYTEELLVAQRGSRMFTDRIFRKFMITELVHQGKTPLVVLP